MNQLTFKEKFLLTKGIRKKCKEFTLQGYNSVDERGIWEYLFAYCWKKEVPQTILEKKNAIANIEANDFFDYQRLKATTDSTQTFDWNRIEDLL